MAKGIDGVIHEHRGVAHSDERRTILTAFNGDVGDFVARQVKIAEMHQDAELGSHAHPYAELFYLLQGEGHWNLKDIDTGREAEYDFVRGDVLLIPARVAHKVSFKENSVLIGCTERPYVSPEENDIPYKF